VIKLATADDADDIARLMLLFRDWYGREWPPDESWRRGVEKLLADDHTDFLLGGEPASGIAVLRYRHSLWQDALDCCLEDLYVEEHARGSGLGEQLVSAALERARERGCRRVELDVNEANEPAHALYEKLGFSSFMKELPGRNLLMRHYFD
jgi:ribosomal protein S18 acetylase RimI-like enzyme